MASIVCVRVCVSACVYQDNSQSLPQGLVCLMYSCCLWTVQTNTCYIYYIERIYIINFGVIGYMVCRMDTNIHTKKLISSVLLIIYFFHYGIDCCIKCTLLFHPPNTHCVIALISQYLIKSCNHNEVLILWSNQDSYGSESCGKSGISTMRCNQNVSQISSIFFPLVWSVTRLKMTI